MKKEKMMKAQIIAPVDGYSRYWVPVFNLLALLLITSCSSSDSTTPFTPVNSLEGKVIVLGAQEDDTSGDLVIYMHGTDLSGTVLTVADMQTAIVNVNTVGFTTTSNPADLTIDGVTASDNFLSLSLVTDWSNSTNGELQFVDGIYTQLLINLPDVFEAQVITFSNTYEVQQDWTTALAELLLVVDPTTDVGAHSSRSRTSLYDSMLFALEANAGDYTDGLIDKCRPAHVMVVFTDGDDNQSSNITDPADIQTLVNADKTVSIMLGTSDAKTAVLETLAGEHGAVVQVGDPTSLGAEVEQWVASLQNIVKITVDSGIYTDGDTVSITMGSKTVAVHPNSHCQATP